MRVTFEFDDEDQEDHEKRVLMEHSMDLLSCVTDIYERCRRLTKYETDPVTGEELATEIRSIIADHELGSLL